MKRRAVSILIAEDHAIVSEGLPTLLDLSGEFEVVGEAVTGREAVEMATRLQPDVVVMDIAMPILNGFEATRHIRESSTNTKILALSAYSDDEYVEHMHAAGASGYILKQNSGKVLIKAVREIAEGRSYFSPSILNRMRKVELQLSQLREKGNKRQPLTPREAEVLQMIAEGSANKQIAEGLTISIKTVEKHRQKLMDKLHIHDTARLTRHAIATGVIESSIQNTTGR